MAWNTYRPYPFRTVRNPHRNNQHCHWGKVYKGYRVRQELEYGPLIAEYLEKTLEQLKCAMYMHSKVFVMRFDLRFPQWGINSALWSDNSCISDFVKHLQCEVDSARGDKSAKIDYVCVRECDNGKTTFRRRGRNERDSRVPHYHFLLIINGNAFNHLGSYKQRPGTDGYCDNSMAHRVIRAWSKALGLSHSQMPGLVHFCKQKLLEGSEVVERDAAFTVHRDDGPKALIDVFYAASYLCKAYSKDLQPGVRCFFKSQFPLWVRDEVQRDEREEEFPWTDYGTPKVLFNEKVIPGAAV